MTERSFLHWRGIGIAALLVIAGGSPARLSAADDVGSLLVESDPAGATVYLDGRLAGQTPLTLAAIAPGVHRVQIARAGYLENGRLVTVKAGARASVRTQLTAAAPPLKIVVIEGEGAVNIIQQKTAVAPVIEVRDRNDQPVSGALVRFAISKGRATFNGARTLTATTDALGRASAAGLAPTGSGPLSIAASAAFQGQTAVATIAQVNVLTAAQAASASAAAATSGSVAGGGGGGLSATTLSIVGAAAAGGIVAAKMIAADAPISGTFSGPVTGRSQLIGTNLPPATGTCVETYDTNGTVAITLLPGSDKMVSGSATATIRHSIVAIDRCTPGLLGLTFTETWNLPVTGTEQSLSFNGQRPYTGTPINGGSETGNISIAFSGRFVDGALSGTIVRTSAGSGNSQGISFTNSWTATFDVTFRR